MGEICASVTPVENAECKPTLSYASAKRLNGHNKDSGCTCTLAKPARYQVMTPSQASGQGIAACPDTSLWHSDRRCKLLAVKVMAYAIIMNARSGQRSMPRYFCPYPTVNGNQRTGPLARPATSWLMNGSQARGRDSAACPDTSVKANWTDNGTQSTGTPARLAR